MKKLRLDDLVVESFAVEDKSPPAQGTVKANASDVFGSPCSALGDVTCAQTCWETCPATCPGTCYQTCAGGHTCYQSCIGGGCGGGWTAGPDQDCIGEGTQHWATCVAISCPC